MSTIRDELVHASLERAYALLDYNIHDNLGKRFEFFRRTILADKSLTKDEKSEAITSGIFFREKSTEKSTSNIVGICGNLSRSK